MRRSLGAVLWTLVGILACFLGGLSALVGTAAGRKLLARVAVTALQGAVAGQVEIQGVSGTLLTGLSLQDVRLYDEDTTLVAWLPRVEVDYNLLDFAAGRTVLQRVLLVRPYVNIVQHKSGRLNIEELLRLGGPSNPHPGPKPLVVLRNVAINDGDLVLRLQSKPAPDDSLHEIDAFDADGRRRVRRLQHLTAFLPAFRISAPGQRGLRLELAGLAVQIDDPPVTLTDMRGQVAIDGDSLDVDLPAVRLPASRVAVRGRLAWPHDTLRYDLAIKATAASLADVRFIDPHFPDGAVVRGGVTVRSHGTRVIEVRLDPLDLGYLGGRARGKVTALIAADSGLVALRSTEVQADDLDLSLFRAFIDSLPFHGHLTGHTSADGPMSELGLDADWVFRDSLVPGHPESRVKGQGRIDLRAPVGVSFAPFTVNDAAIDFGTIGHFVPSSVLGTLDAQGTLIGPLKNFSFEGALRHHDGTRPATVLHGRFGANALGAILALDIDAQVDTLSFDGLAPSFPALPLTGGMTGNARLVGRLDSLGTHIDMSRIGGGGRIRADGGLVLLPHRSGTRGLEVNATDLSLDRWHPGAPPSALNFTLSGTIDVDSSGSTATGQVAGRLRASRVAGTDLDSGAVRLRFEAGRILVDTVWLRQPGLITDGGGSLGWRRPGAGETRLTLDADSLSFLDPLVAWIAGTTGDTARAVLSRGAGAATVRVAGALDSIAIGLQGDVDLLAYGDWEVIRGHADGGYEPGRPARVHLDVRADSVAHGGTGFGAPAASASGRLDSLRWSGRTHIGDLSAIVAGGGYSRDSITGLVVAFDSLAVLLPHGVWYLTRPASLRWRDSTLVLDSVAMEQVGGPGRLAVEGAIPTASGEGSAHIHIQAFPLAGVYAMLQQDTVGAPGNVAADLTVRGSRREPEYRGEFAVVTDSNGAPSLDGTFVYAQRRLDASASLKHSGRQVVAFTAHLPLDLALTDVPRRQLPDTLAIRARADSADLSALDAVTASLRNVRGRLTADLGIRGRWDAPRLDGALRIDSAGLDIPSLNVQWDNIVGRLRLGGDTIYVDTLNVRSDHGRADLSGSVRLERLSRPVLALNIDAQDFKALEIRGNLGVTASAQLTLRGPVFGATLSGRGTVTNGVLYFADLVEKRIIDLDSPNPALVGLIDTSLAAVIRRQGLGPAFHNVFLDSLGIRDLQLTMGGSVWLRSNEANIQLTGRMSVNKQHRTYRVTGTLQAPRGTYRLQVGPVTREFIVTSGTVNYFGTPDLDAGLDIEAEHVVHPVQTATSTASAGGRCSTGGDVTVVAHIGGTLLVPRLTLSAKDCTLPQTDIISYLMFGQPSADIANADLGTAAASRKALLLSTAASVAAGEIERSVVSDLGVPLDYVEIRPGDPGNPLQGASFAVGKQIGAKTFFIVRASLCPGAVTNAVGASLQFRISPEWRTEASVEPVGTCTSIRSTLQRQVGVDLFWESRY
jgi:hypothetical protein